MLFLKDRNICVAIRIINEVNISALVSIELCDLWLLHRTDGGHNNLRTAAYEALMSLIKHSAKDCYTVIRETTQIILTRLQQAVQLDVSSITTSVINSVILCVTTSITLCHY